VDEAIWPAAAPTGSDQHDVTLTNGPLDLNPNQPRAQIEDQVVPFVAHRLKDADTSLQCFQHNRLFRDRALLIRRQHVHMVPVEPDGLLPVL
jgi:hypothetical protein